MKVIIILVCWQNTAIVVLIIRRSVNIIYLQLISWTPYDQTDEVKVFKSLLINKTDERYSAQLAEIADSELPQGDVEVNIDYRFVQKTVLAWDN